MTQSDNNHRNKNPRRRKDRPLEGIRVVDFTWVRAGPWAARWLATLGAEVIKVEWPENLDMLRLNRFTVPTGVEPGPNSTGQFADTNAGKLGITVNVRHPKGLEAIKNLISVSDVVIENFSSRIMQRWGLGYEDLRKLRPDVVYVSMAGFGHTGRQGNLSLWFCPPIPCGGPGLPRYQKRGGLRLLPNGYQH